MSDLAIHIRFEEADEVHSLYELVTVPNHEEARELALDYFWGVHPYATIERVSLVRADDYQTVKEW